MCLYLSVTFCDWKGLLSGARQIFYLLLGGFSTCMNTWICTRVFNCIPIHIFVYIHVSLCICKYSLYKISQEIKVIKYLTLHTLQSECESNHLKKKKRKKKVGETDRMK